MTGLYFTVSLLAGLEADRERGAIRAMLFIMSGVLAINGILDTLIALGKVLAP